MDPLSVTASIISVLQLASSIVSVCYQFRAACKQDPWSLTRVIDEIKDLRNVLEALERICKGLETTSDDDDRRLRSFRLLCQPESGPLARCHEELRNLENSIAASGGDKASVSKGRAIFQVIRWRLKEGDAFAALDRINRCKSTIQLALTADETTMILDIREMTATLNSSVEQVDRNVSELLTRLRDQDADEEARAVREWLSPTNPWENHEQASRAHNSNTGDWLIGSQPFRDWCLHDRSCLWLTGFPGSGKTILFSRVIASLAGEDASVSDTSCLAFFYSDFRDRESQSAVNVIGSWVSQLCSQMKSYPDELLHAFHSSNNVNSAQTRPSVLLLRDLILSMSRDRRISLLVDAIDECEERQQLLDFVLDLLGAGTKISVLITSRNAEDVSEKLESFQRLRLEDWSDRTNKDIEVYIDYRLKTNPRLQWIRGNVKDEIQRALKTSSAGMFRLVQCRLDAISTLRTVRQMRLALEDLPKGLAQMYENILLKIPQDDAFLVRRILLWLSFSVLPLSLEELHSAIAIEQGDEELDEDSFLGNPRDMLAMCGSLIDVSDMGYVRLAHKSVKDYLVSDDIRTGPVSMFATDYASGKRELALNCLTYLSFRGLRTGPCQSADAFAARLQTYPLLRHVSKAWTYYLRGAGPSIEVDDQAIGFFSASSRLAFMSWVQVLNASSTSKWNVYPRHATSLYYAASFGLGALVNALILNGANLDAPGSRFGGTALHAAVIRHHTAVVQTLLEAGATPNRSDFSGISPLHSAAVYAHIDLIKLLLEHGASKEARDQGGKTPLDWAIVGKQKASQELLAGGAGLPAEESQEDGVQPGQA